VLEISKDRVKLGVSAPKDITIIRYELITTQNANREAAELISKDALNALINASKKS
jgi:carbon storage regulator CsrA